MNDLGFWAVLLILLTPLFAFLLVLMIWATAHLNTGWTLVKQGHIKTIMTGESLSRQIVNVENFRRDPDADGALVKETDPSKDGRSWWNRHLGIYWIGLPPFFSILIYTLKWNKLEKEKESEMSILKPREMEVDSIIFAYPYGIKLKDVEIGGNLIVDIELLVTIWALNPRKMMFNSLPSGTWLQQVEGSIREVVTLYAADKSLADLKALKTTGKEKTIPATARAFSNTIKYINHRQKDKNTDGIEELFGAHIEVVNFLGLKVVGAEATRAAAEKVAQAQLDAEALRTTADANAYKTEKEGNALNKVIKTRKEDLAESYGDHVLGEAIGQAKPTTLVINRGDKDDGVKPVIQIGSGS